MRSSTRRSAVLSESVACRAKGLARSAPRRVVEAADFSPLAELRDLRREPLPVGAAHVAARAVAGEGGLGPRPRRRSRSRAACSTRPAGVEQRMGEGRDARGDLRRACPRVSPAPRPLRGLQHAAVRARVRPGRHVGRGGDGGWCSASVEDRGGFRRTLGRCRACGVDRSRGSRPSGRLQAPPRLRGRRVQLGAHAQGPAGEAPLRPRLRVPLPSPAGVQLFACVAGGEVLTREQGWHRGRDGTHLRNRLLAELSIDKKRIEERARRDQSEMPSS